MKLKFNPVLECESAKDIGRRIAALRCERGWTQLELAEMIGVDRHTVSKWESGSSELSLDAWFALSQLFGVSTDYISGTSKHRRFKGSSLSDKIDLDKLNELGVHLMYEFYHMLLANQAFSKNKLDE